MCVREVNGREDSEEERAVQGQTPHSHSLLLHLAINRNSKDMRDVGENVEICRHPLGLVF